MENHRSDDYYIFGCCFLILNKNFFTKQNPTLKSYLAPCPNQSLPPFQYLTHSNKIIMYSDYLIREEKDSFKKMISYGFET